MLLPPSFVCVTVPPLTLAPEKTPLVWESAASTIEAAESTSRVDVMTTETRKRVSRFERSMSFLLVEALLHAHRLDAAGGGRFQELEAYINSDISTQRDSRTKAQGSSRPALGFGAAPRVAAGKAQRAARGPDSPPRRRCTMKRQPGQV